MRDKFLNQAYDVLNTHLYVTHTQSSFAIDCGEYEIRNINRTLAKVMQNTIVCINKYLYRFMYILCIYFN